LAIQCSLIFCRILLEHICIRLRGPSVEQKIFLYKKLRCAHVWPSDAHKIQYKTKTMQIYLWKTHFFLIFLFLSKQNEHWIEMLFGFIEVCILVSNQWQTKNKIGIQKYPYSALRIFNENFSSWFLARSQSYKTLFPFWFQICVNGKIHDVQTREH